jgi:chromosome segregation ATPase
VRRLLELIAAAVRQNRFDRPPIGPIGAAVSLADERYALAVEAAIGKCFDGFIVSSNRDLNTLVVRPCSPCCQCAA